MQQLATLRRIIIVDQLYHHSYKTILFQKNQHLFSVAFTSERFSEMKIRYFEKKYKQYVADESGKRIFDIGYKCDRSRIWGGILLRSNPELEHYCVVAAWGFYNFATLSPLATIRPKPPISP
jgi:hypothetical protein